MKQKIIYLAILAFTFATQAMAQGFTLQGRVTDQDNNPVELATVSVLKQGKVAFTSLKGEFSMHLQSADSVVVKFTMIGYKPKVRILRHPKGKQTLQVVLFTDDNTLAEVQVTGQKIQTGQTEELKAEDAKLAPSASGNGVEGLIQQQAGVSTHNELSSQYNVRGGAFDENSVYINNVEVYRPLLVRSGQQEGLSVINPYMVDKIGFSTGGYAAKYGDKMSSALDITRIRFHNHVDTSIDGDAERILLVLRHHLTSIEIVDVCPVGDEHTIPSSLFLQPSCQDVLVGVHRHTVDGSGIHHHGQGSSLQTRQERSEVLLSQVGWRDIGWRTVFTGPRHTIAHEVLH